MIAKVFLLILFQYNYLSLGSFENQFCDKTYKDSLLALGGIFSIGDTLFATRRYPNTDQSIVWKFKLKAIKNRPEFKDNKFEITDMSSHKMKSLFPGLLFDYFVSGFAITDTNSCSDKSKECVNTSHMKNLTVILGPNNSDSKQLYSVYRFNGIAFTAVNPQTDALPLGLAQTGTTTHWFSPKAFISTTFRDNQKQIIAFNYGDKTINKLDLSNYSEHKIGNRYWNVLVSNISIQSFSYHLIELKVTETQKELLLITQQMVYQLVDDKRFQELMHPWNLFGCKSVTVSLRTENDASPKFNKPGVKVEQYENLNTKLILQLIVSNVIYILLISGIFWLIFYF